MKRTRTKLKKLDRAILVVEELLADYGPDSQHAVTVGEVRHVEGVLWKVMEALRRIRDGRECRRPRAVGPDGRK